MNPADKEPPSPQSMGGTARAKALTPEERAKIASDAAYARWNVRKAQPLVLPLQAGEVEIPSAMSEEDFNLLVSTLHLWKSKLVIQPPENGA